MESPSKKELIESILKLTHRERDYEYKNLLWNYYPYNDLVALKLYHERRQKRGAIIGMYKWNLKH